MLYTQDLTSVFSDAIGKTGIKASHLDLYRQKFLASLKKNKTLFDTGALPLFKLPHLRKDIADLTPIVERFQDDFTDIVVLGTGGSSLGGQTLSVLAQPNTPHVHFLDNIDQATFNTLFNKLSPHSTAFIIISKSGGTVETLMQCLTCLDYWREHANAYAIKDHFLIITEKKDSPLTKIAAHWNIPTLPHDPDLGGRFSVLSTVGLLPALIQNVDVLALREGARQVLDQTLNETTFEKNVPGMGAVTSVLLAEKYPNTVLMPYVDNLAFFSKWYRQLWAESLGKNGKGTTPIDALGTVDQHSQLQLYLDGPSDKAYTLIGRAYNAENSSTKENADIPEDPTLSLLSEKGMDALLRAEYEATRDTLIHHKKPVRTFEIKTLDAPTLGALLMHFMMETIFSADLLDVNAFDQPAVEEGKVLAKKYLKKMN